MAASRSPTRQHTTPRNHASPTLYCNGLMLLADRVSAMCRLAAVPHGLLLGTVLLHLALRRGMQHSVDTLLNWPLAACEQHAHAHHKACNAAARPWVTHRSAPHGAQTPRVDLLPSIVVARPVVSQQRRRTHVAGPAVANSLPHGVPERTLADGVPRCRGRMHAVCTPGAHQSSASAQRSPARLQ